MAYYLTKKIKGQSFEQVEKIVRESLKEQGFGVITEIDVQATLKDKLNVDFRDYKILGACNPKFAHLALLANDKIGVLLPCNVCIQVLPEGIIEVSTINPMEAMKPLATENMEAFAYEVATRLISVLENIP